MPSHLHGYLERKLSVTLTNKCFCSIKLDIASKTSIAVVNVRMPFLLFLLDFLVVAR